MERQVDASRVILKLKGIIGELQTQLAIDQVLLEDAYERIAVLEKQVQPEPQE